VDHPAQLSDDLANAVAGVANLLSGAAVDTRGIRLVGERLMFRRDWIDQESYQGEGSQIEAAFDSGELSRRSKWDW